MYSLLIKNANIIDGSGKKGFAADVAVEGDKIVAVSEKITVGAKQIFDGTGLILTPGFIDVQNHSDSYWQLFDNPALESLVTQGYTTILVGSSGSSLAPLLSEQSLLGIQKWKPTSGINVNWRTYKEYAEQLAGKKYGANVSTLIGYSTVRRGLLGDSVSAPTKEDLDALTKLLEECLVAGAKGVSLGLQYSHELNVSEAEIFNLAQLCAKHNKVLAVSLRNESSEMIANIRELAAIAEQTGVRLKISHLKIRFRNNQNLLTELLDTLESSWHRGVKISFDSYPYDFTWQPLYTYLPKWAIEGGRSKMLERLKDEVQHKKILSYLRDHPGKITELIIASTGPNLKVNGKAVSKIAKDMNLTSEEAVLSLIKSGGSSVLVFDKCLDPKTVSIINNHAMGLIATNGGGFNLIHGENLVHPRSFGTSTKFLRSVIDDKSISLEEAVAKLSGRAAEVAGLTDRGILKTGNYADLVLFDPAHINSEASMSNPYQYSKGITAVWVNGELTVRNGLPLETLAGTFI
ncbi:amidohydrolase family protein [bacterium]|nr:MAG: amidohydrolase family protein [bacterium]